MGSYTIFTDWKNQHNKNVNSPQFDLSVIPIKILSRFSVGIDKVNTKFIC